ncbi:MAG: hypothetical protein H0T70_10100 [Acidimicrobiia bacterium]|nr:hypothetical protein [Acidimicrobiia bacterium]
MPDPPEPVDQTLLPPTVERRRRRRRPSGAPPPFPRKLGNTGQGWLVVSLAVLVWSLVALNAEWARRATDRADAAVLRQLSRLRTDWLTDVMSAVHRAGSGWAVTTVALLLIVALVGFRRWRHLFTFLAAAFVLEFIGGLVYHGFSRPRPYDVAIIGRWAGFSMPAATVAVLAMIGLAITYGLVVAGRPRTMAKAATASVVAIFTAAELYLAVYHPSDIVLGVAFTVAIFVNAFRFFTPNEAFPVAYRRGKTAHLDVGGLRGEAIRQALQDQLGLTVVDVAPVGLAGSGGSTPLRICVAGEPNTYLFGKLYAMNHVRADRWYKLGRTILYGRLEDEAPFNSVRRLVEYEDYASRLLRDIGVPTATPFGIVELTPEREYLFVTEFFDGAVEIGDAEVDDDLIDEGLNLIRRLWDAGVAHRDIKPANLMVRGGHVLLIDTAFVQVRPSPWRQAVDLANMMLVLAVRTDAERVYQRALRLFTPDEIAEAFAAARGVASPTQLRTMMKSDGRNLVAQFRALAPERRPIGLQRWGVRRIALALALLGGTAFAVQAAVGMVTPAYDLGVSGTPSCGTGDLMILMAQSVPSATAVPCIDSLPAGWSLGDAHVRRGHASFWLDSDRAGKRAVQAELRPPGDCPVTDAVEVPSDEVGMRRYEKPERLPPNLRSSRTYLFDGGCIIYRFSFSGPATASVMFDVDRALAAEPRTELVAAVRDRTDLRLCGAGAACPER